MNNLFLNTINKYGMIQQGDTVAVCLSGGADSMALFHLVNSYKEFFRINVIALHVNHGLREESREEEIFIRKYCDDMGVKCIVYNADMNNRQKPQGMSTEMWARQERYNFFFENAKKYNAKLATAHTLSDKCETIIFNITRGANLKGLCGIPAVRDNIIRPLINCTRMDIEKYCSENNIPFVTDKTNFEEEYSRNKIRLKVIPVLKKINERVEYQIGEFSEEMEQIYTFLTQLSDTLYKNSITTKGFDTEIIRKYDDVVIKFFLRNVLEKYDCISKENINDILLGIRNNKFSRQLSKDIICRIDNGFLIFGKIHTKKDIEIQEKIPVELEKISEFLSKKYMIRKISLEEFKKNKKNDKNYLKNCIDCDTIKCKMFFRTRITGDIFTLQKRNVTKTLKKLFIEDKIPLEIRNSMTILSDMDNNVIWLENYGVNSHFAVGEKTRNILVIEKM